MKSTRGALLAIGVVLASTAWVAAHDKLGHVHFPISCSAASQEEFDRALAMLHSFWFPQTTRAFTEISQTEPDCAMASYSSFMTSARRARYASRVG